MDTEFTLFYNGTNKYKFYFNDLHSLHLSESTFRHELKENDGTHNNYKWKINEEKDVGFFLIVLIIFISQK